MSHEGIPSLDEGSPNWKPSPSKPPQINLIPLPPFFPEVHSQGGTLTIAVDEIEVVDGGQWSLVVTNNTPAELLVDVVVDQPDR